VGGAGLVFSEATAVVPEGRISPQDLGLWKDEHIEPLALAVHFVAQNGAVPGIQLAHAGRKASTFRPWSGHGAVSPEQGGWTTVAPSAVAFAPNYPMPVALDLAGIARVKQAFVDAAVRAQEAGFKVIELHAAHGYLLHQFLSPLSNQRQDQYGGSFENRVRLVRETAQALRAKWPESLPLFVRISASDWVEGGWDLEQSVELAKLLKQDGADLIDTSSGGLDPRQQIPIGPGYQTPFAERLRREAKVATGAVGLIRDAWQAEHILRNGQADLVFLARELLRDPYWPLRAAKALNVKIDWPVQYERARD
jgi:2,4-dienoyl-CoA reductase-like NADH-dependent reductase (Old Yellow Enzyme family)